MNVLAVLKTAGKTATRWVCTHKKALLITAGVACTAGAIVVATVQAPIAKEALDAMPEPEETDTKVDILVKKAKTVAPIMWPVPVLGGVGVGCFCTAVHISGKEVTRAISDGLAWKQAYNELAHIHNDYVNANRKISGEENHQKVQEEVYSNRIREIGSSVIIENTGRGDEIFYDSLTGKFFRSTSTYIANAAMDFKDAMHNAQLPNPDAWSGFGTMSEWCEDFLLIGCGKVGEDLGWYDVDREGFNTKYNPFKIYITEHFITAPDGSPARVIEYDCLPTES